MATSESKLKANAKYDKAHTTGVFLKLNKETDKDILEKLSSVPNRQGYVKDLIRKDISSVPENDTDSVPVPFMDPFAGTIAKAIGTWIDTSTLTLSDGKPYIIADSVPESEGE